MDADGFVVVSQTEMRQALGMKTLRTAGDIVAAGLAPVSDLARLERVGARYAIGVTPQLAGLIDRADPGDPIARQFVPSDAELATRPDEHGDPIGDEAHAQIEGIVHRYPDRVLLKVVAVCPVYCRFCFRRERVGPDKDNALSPAALEQALAYVAAHPDIWEVIVSGGDPFMLSARRARALTEALETIPHVKVVRWHTRMPVADPTRVDDAFVAALRSTSKAVHVVAHVNHARELTAAARAACARLIDAGIPVLSQSVLLRGVNDNVDTLADLMRALVEARVHPYYLHHPDRAPGTSHFRLPVAEGQMLVQALRDRLSGLCQPTYVIDIPGGVSKALAAAPDITREADGLKLRGRDGAWRSYSEDG